MNAPLVFVETDHSLPLVHLTVSLRTGAALDPDGRDGLSRFAARLMRRTGGGLDASEIDNRLDTLGGALGVEASHSTLSFSGTVIRRSLEPFWELLEQVVMSPGFGSEEFSRLKRETVGELIEGQDNDRSVANRWFRRQLFGSHPYGRSVSGWPSTIEGIELSDMATWWKRTITQDNLVLSFAGDIEAEEATALAARLTSAAQPGPAPKDGVLEPTGPKGRHLVFVDKPERSQTQIYIGCLGSHPKDGDHIPLHVANTAFGGTFTARLTDEVRSKRGWSYGAYSSLSYGRQRSSFSLWTFPKAEDAPACIALQLDMLKTWRDKGLTQEELDRAKKYLVNSHAFSVDTASKRVGVRLDTELYRLPKDHFEQYTRNVEAVSLEEANAAVRAHVDERNLVTALVGTEAAIGAKVREAIPGLESERVVAFDSE